MNNEKLIFIALVALVPLSALGKERADLELIVTTIAGYTSVPRPRRGCLAGARGEGGLRRRARGPARAGGMATLLLTPPPYQN